MRGDPICDVNDLHLPALPLLWSAHRSRDPSARPDSQCSVKKFCAVSISHRWRFACFRAGRHSSRCMATARSPRIRTQNVEHAAVPLRGAFRCAGPGNGLALPSRAPNSSHKVIRPSTICHRSACAEIYRPGGASGRLQPSASPTAARTVLMRSPSADGRKLTSSFTAGRAFFDPRLVMSFKGWTVVKLLHRC